MAISIIQSIVFQEKKVRKYPKDSPQAAARLVVLALLADGIVDGSEARLLERQDVVARLGLEHEQFDKVFYEFCEDLLGNATRLATGQLELDTHNIQKLLDEICEPTLQKKMLRIMLDIVNADCCLTAAEAALVAQAQKAWELDLFEVADSSIPRHRNKVGLPGLEVGALVKRDGLGTDSSIHDVNQRSLTC